MYYENGNAGKIAKGIIEMTRKSEEIFMIFVAESSAGEVPDLIEKLNEAEVPFFGAVFPRLILGNDNLTEGMLVRKVPTLHPPVLIREIKSKSYQLHKIDGFKEWSNEGNLMILVDGLTSHVGHFLTGVYNRFGNDMQFMGAGAGYLSLEQGPCLFNQEGYFEDAAILCQLTTACSLGVRHGWDPVFGPLVANKTEANVIKQLNWRPAIDVYKEVVSKESGLSFDTTSFAEIAKGFPFGMDRSEGESVVRDPIAVDEDGGLICLGEVPEYSILTILTGNNDSLISAAEQAASDTKPNPSVNADALIFDCITRVMFLEDDYSLELDSVISTVNEEREGRPAEVYGALTMGEISSPGKGFLELYNKTIVVALLDES